MAVVTKRRTYHACFLAVFAGVSSVRLLAQDTLVRSLDEFVFTEEKRKQVNTGFNAQAVDTMALKDYKSRNLSDLLADQSGLFIKSYGLGSLSTISLRGAGAAQTAVLWNGLALQSPMNGQIDLALLPAFFTDRMDIQYGSSAASWGSGAIGGALLLSNQPSFDKGLQADAGLVYGSFNNRQGLLKLGYGNKKMFVSGRAFSAAADNDFPFVNFTKAGSPVERQKNAHLQQSGVMTEAGYIPARGHNIIIRHWYQFTHRQIPPVMSKDNSISYQDDLNNRATAEWNRTGMKVNSVVKVAWFDEGIDFKSDEGVLNHNRSRTWILNAEASCKAGKNLNISGGVMNTYATGRSEGYSGHPAQNRLAVFATGRLVTARRRLVLQVVVREEVAGPTLVPFTPSLSAEYRLTEWLLVGANVSRSYRIPTFNDLFWTTGNPSLKAESGWNEEGFIRATFRHRAFRLQASVSAYNRVISNLIVWLPKIGYWSPENIMGVWSRGGELGTDASWQKKDWTLRLLGSVSLVHSTNTGTEIENDESVGKQRIYVPYITAYGRLDLAYRKLRLSYSQTYTGLRYISTDNSDFLDPNTVATLRLSWSPKIKSCTVDLFAEMHNVYDVQYQVIAQRPMPGRYYQGGILFSLTKTYKHP